MNQLCTPAITDRPPGWLTYVAPLGLFVALTTVEGWLPARWYPAAYATKVALVTIAAVAGRRAWRDLRPAWRDLLPALLVGVAAWAIWVGLDRWPGYPHLGSRTGFDPYRAIADPAARSAFLAVRFYGLVLLVPLIEELVWRDFLLRYLTRPEDFRAVPLDRFSLQSGLLSGGAFALAHPEWLAAAVIATLYTLLVRSRASVFAAALAHAVTNLCLGIYVLQTGDWRYW
jgi:CAAX prenyl protease-like protein